MAKKQRILTIKKIDGVRTEIRNLKRRWTIKIECDVNFVMISRHLTASKNAINDLFSKNFSASVKNNVVTPIQMMFIAKPSLEFELSIIFADEGGEAAFIMSKDGLLDTEIKF